MFSCGPVLQIFGSDLRKNYENTVRISEITFKTDGALLKKFESGGGLRLNISHECGWNLSPFIFLIYIFNYRGNYSRPK